MKKLFLIGTLCAIASWTNAQCGAGQVEVFIDVSTDNWGYEQYWELLPAGNPCGTGVIFAGGNTTQLGCADGGLPASATTGNGYGDNTTVTEGPWCLTDGVDYNIYFVDDYGDGGGDFEVRIEGFPIYNFSAASTDERFNFTAAGPPNLDAELTSISVPMYTYAGNVPVKATVTNTGITTITSIDLEYTIDGGAAVSDNITGLSIAPFASAIVTHSTAWNAATAGNYTVDVTIAGVNGVADDDALNNEQSQVVIVNDAIPNIIADYVSAPASVVYNVIGTAADQVDAPRDLDFAPDGILWSINTNTEGSGGSTIKWTNPGEPGQTDLWQRDGNAWHFMSLPTAIAFSDNGLFGTTPGVYDANHDGGAPFTGPSLWSMDPAIYAQPSGGNGSHMDMLHASPYGMGMAAVTANQFYVFDANSNDIVFYDFVEDHGPGNSYHGDAIIRRYTGTTVNWISDQISSHMEMAPGTDWLYFVDGGNQRVMRLDISSGTIGGTPTNFSNPETVAEYSTVNGATFETVVSSGLTEPSGIDIIDDRMIVTDHSNGDIIIYDISSIPASELARIQTGAPGIQGIVIGPNGNFWYANAADNEIVKVEPAVTTTINETAGVDFQVYPNPASEQVIVKLTTGSLNGARITLNDLSGKIVHAQTANSLSESIDVSGLSSGMYYLTVKLNNQSNTRKVVVK